MTDTSKEPARRGTAASPRDERPSVGTTGQGPQGADRPESQARIHAADAKQQAQRAPADVAGTADAVKQQTRQAADKVTAATRQAGAEMRQSASEAASWAQRESAAVANRQKNRVGEELGNFGSALRSAASRLQETDDKGIARYAEQAADQLDSTARYLRQRDITGLAEDLETFARRNPEVFLGGMFLAGLGISRFLKSSRHHGA